MKFWKLASAIMAFILSTTVNAAIIDNDTYTTDTVSGLDWLDLTETTNMSYNDIATQLNVGGALEGWRYATESEIIGFFDAFGGDNNYYDGWSTQNNGLFDKVSLVWGDTYCNMSHVSCELGDGYSLFLYDGNYSSDIYATEGLIFDRNGYTDQPDYDWVVVSQSYISRDIAYTDHGSALVREVSSVPVPAAIWMFSSGLIGLVGLARCKKA